MRERPDAALGTAGGKVLPFVPPKHWGEVPGFLRGREHQTPAGVACEFVITFLNWAESTVAEEGTIGEAIREMYPVARTVIQPYAEADPIAKALFAELLAFGLGIEKHTRADVESILQAAEEAAAKDADAKVAAAVRQIRTEVINSMDRAEEMADRYGCHEAPRQAR